MPEKKKMKNEKYYTIRTVPKFNWKIVLVTQAKSIPLTHIYKTAHCSGI